MWIEVSELIMKIETQYPYGQFKAQFLLKDNNAANNNIQSYVNRLPLTEQ